jgi:hypothetical protein
MSPPRYREKGFSTEPSIATRVFMVDSWHPENGITAIDKISDQPDWYIAHRDASIIEDFVSDTGANASGDYTMARTATHYGVSNSSLHGTTVEWNTGRYFGQCLFDPRGVPYGNKGFANDFVCPLPPQEIISEFAIQSMNEMDTMFPPEQDFLSFILELKSLVGVIDNLADIAALLEDMSVYDHVSIKRVAKIHAGYNFGVSPILDDFSKLWSTFRSVKKRIEWLLKNKGKWARVGSQKTFELQENSYWGMGFGLAGWSPGVNLYRVNQKHVLHATARAKQLIPDVTGWLLFVKGVIGMAGLDRPLTTFWEQTPFSWAVDYFIPVGDYLKTVQHYRDPNWVCRDPSWSIKSYYDFQLLTSNHAGPPQSCGKFQLKAYRRRVGLPEWEFYQKTPSLKQWSLLAAVAIQED